MECNAYNMQVGVKSRLLWLQNQAEAELRDPQVALKILASAEQKGIINLIIINFQAKPSISLLSWIEYCI